MDITKLLSKAKTQNGELFRLPPEIRNRVWELLLTSQDPETTTFGVGSGISIGLLSTCIQACFEARGFLYETRHVLKGPLRLMEGSWAPALRRFEYLTIFFHYCCVYRGDAEIEIRRIDSLLRDTDFIGYHLDTNRTLKELHIELCNEIPRGRGSKRIRYEKVKRQMDDILLPLATLRKDVKVTVGGFDTIEFVDDFDRRRKLASDGPGTTFLSRLEGMLARSEIS